MNRFAKNSSETAQNTPEYTTRDIAQLANYNITLLRAVGNFATPIIESRAQQEMQANAGRFVTEAAGVQNGTPHIDSNAVLRSYVDRAYQDAA